MLGYQKQEKALITFHNLMLFVVNTSLSQSLSPIQYVLKGQSYSNGVGSFCLLIHYSSVIHKCVVHYQGDVCVEEHK